MSRNALCRALLNSKRAIGSREYINRFNLSAETSPRYKSIIVNEIAYITGDELPSSCALIDMQENNAILHVPIEIQIAGEACTLFNRSKMPGDVLIINLLEQHREIVAEQLETIASLTKQVQTLTVQCGKYKAVFGAITNVSSLE